MGRIIKLVMVTGENNNKFYDMEELPNGNWKGTWGRIGVTSTSREFPMSKWEKKYREEIKKGYKDVTDLLTVETHEGKKANQLDADFKAGRASAVIEIVKKLQAYAKHSIALNYTVKVANVTQRQVDTAQECLNDLANSTISDGNLRYINSKLLELYTIIPRRMKNTKDYLLKESESASSQEEFYKDLLFNEQQTLDVMAGQVKLHTDTDEMVDEEVDSAVDIIEASGLEIVEISDAEIQVIKSKMENGHHHKFRRAFKVVNKSSQALYDAHLKKSDNQYTELFWHGSKNENWWSILTTALKIRPANASYQGSMYGDGIYFAREFDKSLGYTSFKGSRWVNGTSNSAFLGLFHVHLGKQLIYERWDTSCYSLSGNVLKTKGYDSTYAKKGISLHRDEFIIYNTAQCTIGYIVEIER